MTQKPEFALNHMAAPGLDCRAFINLAKSLGCRGIELRNDLQDKQLSTLDFMDGEDPEVIGAYAKENGIALLGLSEAYGFNHWSDAMEVKIDLLIRQAIASGAKSISLIPDNGGNHGSDTLRLENLRNALARTLPMLKSANVIGLVEPLGFATSSLRHKREAIELFDAVGGAETYRLVHDTFHHHLASETDYFPDMTGIVHISGISDASLSVGEMQDSHRILVKEDDVLKNLEQIRTLLDHGYQGAFSYEPFSPLVHAFSDPFGEFRNNMAFITNNL